MEQVRVVLREYAAHLPLTIRQVFYRLVGAYGFPKTALAAERLGETLNRARRAGLIPFEHIRDDDFAVHSPRSWASPEALLRTFAAAAERFRLDRQEGQPVRLMLAVEARGMMPQAERVAHDFGVAVISSGGFDSVTAKHALACMAAKWPALEILHIGDRDPSGEALFTALAEDVQAFAPGRDIRFTRLAVTPEQISDLRLPTAPPKPTDRRKFEGKTTAQAEAIAPDVLARIIEDAIRERLDRSAVAAVLAKEDAARKALLPVLRAMQEGGG